MTSIVQLYSTLYIDGQILFFSESFMALNAFQVLQARPEFVSLTSARASAVTHETFGTHALCIRLNSTSIMEILYDNGFKLVNESLVHRNEGSYNVHYILVRERGTGSNAEIAVAQAEVVKG
jgi:hypothetical protein